MAASSSNRVYFLNSLWHFFASIRLTVVVLLSLAVLSVIGTFIPQNESPADYFRVFGPFKYQLMATLDLFDMFHSWWFQGLILVLCINIVVCSVDRLQSTWQTIFGRSRGIDPAQFRKRKSRITFRRNGAMAALKPLYQQRVAAMFGRGPTVPSDAGYAITVDRGRWTRLGVYVVHLSVVVLLVGAFVSSRFGFEGYVNIAEGERADSIQLRNAAQRLALPFTIQCDDFDVQFYEGGQRPKEFRSSISIIKGGRTVYQKDIVMNDPLRYQGINIFQSSYGPMEPSAMDAENARELTENIELSLRSTASGMIYTLTTPLNRQLQLPEDLGALTIEGYTPNARFRGMAVGPSLKATLTPREGDPQSILLPLNHPDFDAMRRGTLVISVANAGAFIQKRYYTGLQVTRDPGVWLVYSGFILMIVGCVVVFFMSHQRLVVAVQPDGTGLKVTVAGTANKNKVGFRYKLARLAEQLEKID